MKTLSLFHCFSMHCLVPYWGDACSAVVSICLSKLFLLLCFYHFCNMKLTAIILWVFTRKAFSKRELLIINCFNSEKEAKIDAQETVDKNAHTKTTIWVPTAVAVGFLSEKEADFSQGVLFLFSGFSTRSCFDILCQITWV